MSNEEAVNPGVPFTLEGETYRLRYSIWADIQLKKLLGGPSLLKGWDSADPEQVVAVIWAGLISDQEEFRGRISDKGTPDSHIQKQLDRIARDLDVGDYAEALKKVFRALKVSLPEAVEGEDDEEKSEDSAEEKKS